MQDNEPAVKVAKHHLKRTQFRYVVARQDLDNPFGIPHLKWMLMLIAAGHMTEDKANRWLGFAQASLIMNGITNLDEERKLVRIAIS